MAIILLAVVSLQAGFAATTYNIDNSTSGGGVSSALSGSSDGDTILLDEGTYSGSNNTNITINKNITIQGNGPRDKIIIDAQKLSRIYTIDTYQNVTFINITFINGYYNGSFDGGGAIFNKGGATFINCVFINNTATNSTPSWGHGGAIFTTYWGYGMGTMTVIGCDFINNTATRGGAIGGYVTNVTIYDSNFINNDAIEDGGAIISNHIENFTIIGSNFTNNSGIINAGAISSMFSSMTIIASDFTNNTANQFGGAITIESTGVNIIKDSNFTNNTATRGGAIYLGVVQNITVTGSNFVNNTATRGGAIFDDCGVYSSINNSNFTGNKAIRGSAIVINGAHMNITDSNFNYNIAYGDGTNYTIINSGLSDSNITNCNITNNTGKGIYNNGTLSIENIISINNSGAGLVNTAVLDGSGNIIDYQSEINITTTVSSNRVTITAKATDESGNVIVGATINFYVNGKLIGSSITNSEGIAQFIYTSSNAGVQNIIAIMPEFNDTNNILAITAIHLAANATTTTTTTFNIVSEKATVITVSAPTINQGKKTNIQVTLKDINGNILKNKKVSLIINKKTYTATTNNNGIAIFNIAGLKGGKHSFTVKFQGDNSYKSSIITKVQIVKAKADLAITSIKKLKSINKKIDRWKITITNKGSLKSKATILKLFHIRKGIKIKDKYFKVKAIGAGKKISIIISYYPDRAYHRYCTAHFTVDPKNKNKEVIIANNKKSIRLKH